MTTMLRRSLYLTCFILLGSCLTFCQADEIIGDVRVQVLSPTLVRIELRGPHGFEDRPTFHIVRRDWPQVPTVRSSDSGYEQVKTDDFVVKVPVDARTLDEIVITRPSGTLLWSMPSPKNKEFFSNNRAYIPHPKEKTQAWAIVDTPRYVPADFSEPWGGGYNVAPQGTAHNGWDLSNHAPDVYVFLPKGDGRQLRCDYLDLTGRADLIPLYALGGWDSRYYPYTQQQAMDKIQMYRNKDIPLDVFVVDTDWRVGASHGYGVNTSLFPDMEAFIDYAHHNHTRVVFNDHPEPQGKVLDFAEVRYRNEGLRGKFDIGLDVWWFDRNWRTAIIPPGGINKEVFGMYLFHWITQDYYPDRRPFIMANVDGVDNGYLHRAPNLAAHRYTMQWTGDTGCNDESLQREIKNTVYAGVYYPFAYVSTDLGGHMGTPTVQQYCRWVQFGAFSPIFRLHCTRGVTRDPWDYPAPAEQVVRDYVQMRMRLLPVFYTAARANYDTGEPILKRCDLNYPGFEAAAGDYQYLLGDDILVAPSLSGEDPGTVVPSAWLSHGAGQSGLSGLYFDNQTLTGDPTLSRTDETIDFDWGRKTPADGLPTDHFSVRWSGTIRLDTDTPVQLGLSADDGCRLWIDDVLVVDRWVNQAETKIWSKTAYTGSQPHKIKIEYFENSGGAICRLCVRQAPVLSEKTKTPVWMPPGAWRNVWSGDSVSGPKSDQALVSLTEMPIFVKEPSMIPLAPQMEYTTQQAWDPVTLDLYPGSGTTATASLYEDDGMSNQYQSGHCRKTSFQMSVNRSQKTLSVTIDPAQGTYDGALSERGWVIRLRQPVGLTTGPRNVQVDGVPTPFHVIARDPKAMPFSVSGGSPDGDVIEIQIPAASVSRQRIVRVDFNDS